MKKLLTLITIGLVTLGAQAQEKKADTTKLKFSGVRIWIIEDIEKADTVQTAKADTTKKKKKDHAFNNWNGIGLGVNGYLNEDGKMEMPKNYEFLELNYNKSLSFHLNFADVQVPIIKNYVSLVSGLGLEFNNYSFRRPITLNAFSDSVAAFTDSTISYSKNKLKASYIEIPLLIHFNTGKKQSKSFHFAVGGYAGYKLGSRTKQFYTIDGYEYEIRKKSDYNLAPFRYGATVRAGYGNCTLFANYAMSELFEGNKGPVLTPFTVGISIGG